VRFQECLQRPARAEIAPSRIPSRRAA
jgi:hypothetical protein